MISLKDYVKRQTGVPLGHPKSLINMIKSAFGAKSFDLFWVYWNPIWSYFLNKYIYKPLRNKVHQFTAIILTFASSGFIHDLVSLLLYKKPSFFITLWFTVMGVIVIVFKKYKLVYSNLNINLRYTSNTALILISFLATKYILYKKFLIEIY